MKKVFILLIAFILTGCSNQPTLTENGEIADSYLQKLGYEVVSYEGESMIIFTKPRLTDMPDEQIWGVQYTEPDEYLDKEILLEKFLIKNHPLDDQFDMGKTNATVMTLNGEVIGGWSFPHSKEPLVGAPYSIDGKTIEEIHGDWQKWNNEWKSKYKK
ncbi:hypothetical protein GJU40_08125 [Bacillus lacus]|uniref:Lipoprotein n=1 Tax=Metabacillus lacus TaxID=1983721 RepID=A0A7X2LZN1_9BACI|nr:hypothetical protein [Metabacillus lacus]MRX72127.1 hypothetical protein [Metabacillus lacus]